MENKEREEFYLKSASQIQDVDLEKLFYLIKKAVINNDKNMIKYETLISIGAENQGKRISRKNLEGFLNSIYKYWWKNWLLPKSKMDHDWQKGIIKRYIDAGVFDPDSNNRIENIYEIMSELSYKNLFEDACRFQGNYFCVVDTDYFSVERQKRAKSFYDAKLYLNIKLENRIELTKKLIDKALKKDMPFVFKFALYDKRTDNIVIYVDYENISDTADLIDEVKKENENLFDGCQVKHPMIAKYRDYMGYGEEAIYGSYNSARTDILTLTYLELSKHYKTDKNYLTDENIIKEFKKNCKRERVDFNNFYRNDNREWWEIYIEE